ncbi:MAG: hypothetical protein MJA27_28300 [Pseudanabaenales cyanobacterium]|nr:hypothetical protein [Pseudanabaenales cyanobacterium]
MDVNNLTDKQIDQQIQMKSTRNLLNVLISIVLLTFIGLNLIRLTVFFLHSQGLL